MVQKNNELPGKKYSNSLNGVVIQDRDHATEAGRGYETGNSAGANPEQLEDLIFANKIVKAHQIQYHCSGKG